MSRDVAPSPWGAVRRLLVMADRLANRLDNDPDDVRPFPGGTLRRWADDRLGHEDIADRLIRRAYVPEAVSITGPGNVLYTLAGMPAAACVCRRPRWSLTDLAVPAFTGEWSA
ncbi:hypothetical protein ACIGN6_31595 [Streptomyces sp. NPDC053792]|uniref:hypothetical protein n=1 Tax=Streptomyces sp. NPDC053792 TaxID=3365716 RepID=UPI0037D3F6FE